VLTLAGRPLAGLAVGAGLVIGSVNGFMARRSLSASIGFHASSLARLGVLTAAGLGAGLLMGLDYAPLVIAGIAAAQLLLAGLAVVETVRT
jgi:hypothetical protein